MFKTDKEAQEKLEMERQKPLWFCPLIDGGCNTSCLCFKGARMEPLSGGHYAVYGPYCDNAMFSEHRFVTNQY